MVKFFDTAQQKDISFYINPRLDKNLLKIQEKLHKKDKDYVIIVDGAEGAGKSVFGMQIAKRIDPSFCLDRVCMNPQEFKSTIVKAGQHQAIIFDEAFTGLSSRSSLSEINRMLVSMMMQMRQKNLFVLVLLPNVFMIDKYVALSRAKALFHIWEKNNNHYWRCFNRSKLKRLILTGAKTYSYAQVSKYVSFRGNFYGKYILNEEEYRDKKRKALEHAEEHIKVSRYIDQRNKIIIGMKESQFFIPFSLKKMSDWIKEKGVQLSPPQLHYIFRVNEEKKAIPQYSAF